jgi:hypothetical protein
MSEFELSRYFKASGSVEFAIVKDRITHLEGQNEVYEIFEVISTATGTISIPADSQVLQGRYGNDGSGNPITALVLQLNGSAPIDAIALDSGGNPVTVTSFNISTGDFVLSAAPISPAAFIYQISIPLISVDNIPAGQIIERYPSFDFNTLGTVTNAENLGGKDGDLVYVKSTQTFYTYEPSGASHTRDGYYVLNTLDGGDTRWLGVGGYFVADNSNYRMHEPTGYSRMFTSTIGDISFDNSTRTFTIQPQTGETSFSYMISGKEYFHSSAKTFQISNVTGNHFVYFDETRNLQEMVNPTLFDIGNIIYQTAYTAHVYWNATTGKGRCFNERHGNKMDGETHANLHLTRGTQFISGCAPSIVGTIDGTGSLDSEMELVIEDGLAADEDLPIVITDGSPQTLSGIAQIPVLYLTGTGDWDWDTATNFPVKSFVGGSGRLAYNNFNGSTWEQLEVPSQQFLNCHLFGTNDILEPIIAIQGQATYVTIISARAGAVTELDNLILTSLPAEEFFPIATYIVQTADAYTNTPKARFRTTADGAEYVEWRFSGLSPTIAPSIHNNLGGRSEIDSHPATAISYTDFDSNEIDVDQQLKKEEYDRLDRSEPTGFENRADTSLTWTHSTRTSVLQPAVDNYVYWVKGRRFVETGIKQVTISTTDGLHFLYILLDGTYFDDEDPPTEELLSGVAFTQLLYWNNTQGIAIHVGDERHGIVMSWADHQYRHFKYGAAYIYGFDMGGFTFGDGSLDSHSQLDVADGMIYDEDLIHILQNNNPQQFTPILQVPIFYQLGTLWYRTEADNFPIIYSGKQGYVAGSVTTIYTGANGRPAYNQDVMGSKQLTEVGRGEYYMIHFLASNDMYYPIIAILGVNVYTKLKDAQAAAYVEIQTLSGLPFVEFTTIGTVICQGDDTYTNSVANRFVQLETGASYVDLRDITTFQGIASNDHNSMNGLQGGSAGLLQFYHLTSLEHDAVQYKFADNMRVNSFDPYSTSTASTFQSLATDGILYVAVGNTGGIVTSPKGDGITWTPRTSGVSDQLRCVIWVADDSQFVAVGANGAIITSPDGITWNVESSGITGQINSIAYGNGVYIIAAENNDGIWTSTNAAVTWTQQVSTLNTWRARYLNGLYFVTYIGNVYVSADGTTWNTYSTGLSGNIYDIHWNGVQYLVHDSAGGVSISANGTSWASQTTGLGSIVLYDAKWDGTQWIIVGQSGTIITSADGVTWTSQTSKTGFDLLNIIWTGTILVAFGASGVVVTSFDAINWYIRRSGLTINIGGNQDGSLFDGELITACVNGAYMLRSEPVDV